MEKGEAYPAIEIFGKLKVPVFGVAGTHVMGLLKEMSRAGLGSLYVPGKTELSAGFMATGYSRVTRNVSFCLVTPGPGFLIGASAMLEAAKKGTPVVFISGQLHKDHRGKGGKALHEFETQFETAAGIMAHTYLPSSPEEVNRDLGKAVSSSLSRPLSPSYVEIPQEALKRHTQVMQHFSISPSQPSPPGKDSLKTIEEMINRSRAPVIFAGFGALFPGCGDKLLAFARKIQAPIFTTISGKGAIPESHPLSGGVFRMSTGKAVMEQGDLLIALGMSFSLLSTGNRRAPFPENVVHVNLGGPSPHLDGSRTVTVNCDVADFLDAVNVDQKGKLDGLSAILKKEKQKSMRDAARKYPLEMSYVGLLENSIPYDADIFTDPTIISYWMRYFFHASGAGRYLYPSGSNSLGFAFPAAVGGLTAMGSRKAFVVTGDGSFPYFSGEIATAAEQGLDISILLVNDSGYGVLREWGRWENLGKIGVNLENPDFRTICQAYGIEYNRAESPEELGENLRRTNSRGGIKLTEIKGKFSPPWKLT